MPGLNNAPDFLRDARFTAVVIPAYQAARTLGAVVRDTHAAMSGAAIYVVDDGSSDGTGRVAQELGAGGRGTGLVVLSHPRNRGKGAALATGITRALADGAAVVVTIDADGQHAPALIPRLVGPLADGSADLVMGARARRHPMPLARRCSNWLSTALASRIGGQAVIDAQTGFRAFTRRVAESIRPAETGYDYETVFLLAALDRGFRVSSVSIPTIYGHSESHFRDWRDTWRVARVFARYGPRIVFGSR